MKQRISSTSFFAYFCFLSALKHHLNDGGGDGDDDDEKKMFQ